MRPLHPASLALILALCSTQTQAQGFLGGQSGLDPKFCETAAIRQTVVYIDDMFMREGQTEWAGKLFEKLKATLVPGERVTVVELSPADGQSREVWTGCWPDYSQEDRQTIAKSHSFFSKNPLKVLEDQQGFFGSGFAGALSDIYDKHRQSRKMIDPASPPAKAILGAISSDGARYAQTKVTIRVVIYSDLAESSELASIFKPLPQPTPNFGKKLGTYLRSSVVYAFGLDADVGGGQEIREATRLFWTDALGSMSATIGGLGSDLTVPNTLPVAARDFSVDLKEGDEPLSGRLSVLVDVDGGLVDSWIGISRLSSAALTGTMRCEVGKSGICILNAATSHGILSDSPSEVLTLRGDTAGSLTGLIGVKGSNVMFPITASIISSR
jgi:hypothetical protein